MTSAARIIKPHAAITPVINIAMEAKKPTEAVDAATLDAAADAASAAVTGSAMIFLCVLVQICVRTFLRMTSVYDKIYTLSRDGGWVGSRSPCDFHHTTIFPG
jgi:hypothetical protein